MSAQDPSLSVLAFQVREHQEAIKSLRHWRGNTDLKIASLEQKIDGLSKDVQELASAVRTSTRRQTQAIVTFAASVLGFALSILIATGRL